jgi:hypothetical protein
LLWLAGLADVNDIALTTDKPPHDFELTPESWTSTFGGLSLAVFGGVTPLARCAASRSALCLAKRHAKNKQNGLY